MTHITWMAMIWQATLDRIGGVAELHFMFAIPLIIELDLISIYLMIFWKVNSFRLTNTFSIKCSCSFSNVRMYRQYQGRLLR